MRATVIVFAQATVGWDGEPIDQVCLHNSDQCLRKLIDIIRWPKDEFSECKLKIIIEDRRRSSAREQALARAFDLRVQHVDHAHFSWRITNILS